MAHYMVQACYKTEQIKALVGSPEDRTEGVRKLIEGLGGKLLHIFYAFGKYDIVAIAEMPDNSSMAAVAMAVIGAGTTSSFKTTPLMTIAEGVEAMKKANALTTGYKAPTG